MPARKRSTRKYGKAAEKRVESAMRRRKRGTLKSGKGGKGGRVTSRKQAIAIGLSEAREEGARVPRKPTARKSTSRKRTTARKSSSTRKSTLARKSAATRKRSTTRKRSRKRSAAR